LRQSEGILSFSASSGSGAVQVDRIVILFHHEARSIKPICLISESAFQEKVMSSLSINSVTNPYQTYGQNSSSQNQSNFQSLANALQSGNLSAAQSAFTSLEQTFQNQNSQQPGQSNPVSNDIQSLSSALNSGNLTSAQQAFAQLQKDMQTQQASGHHHHHHGGGGSQGQAIQSLVSSLSSSSSAGSSSSSTTGNTLNVTA
jgi:hypothetical protein